MTKIYLKTQNLSFMFSPGFDEKCDSIRGKISDHKFLITDSTKFEIHEFNTNFVKNKYVNPLLAAQEIDLPEDPNEYQEALKRMLGYIGIKKRKKRKDAGMKRKPKQQSEEES